MTDDDRPGGIIRAILDLLAEMDERDRREHWSGERTAVDNSISVGSLDDALALESPDDHDPSGRSDSSDERGASPLTTRAYGDDELLVVADLPEVRRADLDVSIDRDERTVTVAVEGERVGRVPLDEYGWTLADVSVNNDVMEALLTRD